MTYYHVESGDRYYIDSPATNWPSCPPSTSPHYLIKKPTQRNLFQNGAAGVVSSQGITREGNPIYMHQVGDGPLEVFESRSNNPPHPSTFSLPPRIRHISSPEEQVSRFQDTAAWFGLPVPQQGTYQGTYQKQEAKESYTQDGFGRPVLTSRFKTETEVYYENLDKHHHIMAKGYLPPSGSVQPTGTFVVPARMSNIPARYEVTRPNLQVITARGSSLVQEKPMVYLPGLVACNNNVNSNGYYATVLSSPTAPAYYTTAANSTGHVQHIQAVDSLRPGVSYGGPRIYQNVIQS